MNLSVKLQTAFLSAVVLVAALPAQAEDRIVRPETAGKTVAANQGITQEYMDEFVQQKILRLPQQQPAQTADSVIRPNQPRFMMPVSNYRKSSGYGYRNHPVLRKVKFHSGVDYAAPTGSPIYAAESGKVEFAGWKKGYGKTVIIQHDERFATLYGHASKYVVSPGEEVKRGQLIAYVGSTGRSTGPHLHFEVMDGQRKVNPDAFVHP
ncbi:M23 family metallopeptidase [Neisseria perflava]|uniref:M23 family metallopeptidase n=1 Tax=Neisseria perflava TaxID=33053 RepID=UPI00209E46F5|nr:M23 family metallopeptidase [Neisseria perflava]MCP1660232.1 murein DD-endopeptidase MepM/ murein hydrolase activator NlpD [Neisseria perflava]MCP1771842.1 murein DD-endopeptidase MepM/ murein hydrolase activator NlpD [Neisseria perflava]